MQRFRGLNGFLCLWVLISLPAHSHGQTRPTTEPADSSTPKGALRVLNLALRDGDAKAIESVLLARTPVEKRMVEARAAYAVALAGLYKAAAAAFGEEGANTVTSDLKGESAQGLAAINKAEVTIDQDQATIRYPGAHDRPLRLMRVGNTWKISLWPSEQEANPGLMEERLSELHALAEQATALSVEISMGKFSDAEKAAQVWRNRVLETVAPTTQPGK